METPKRRGRPRKAKLENHYKVLGVRANASPEKIRQAYVSLVKQNSPETHPEEFQRIRLAYETLRDPDRRRQYDIMRKYGNKMEKELERAEFFMEVEEWQEAIAVYEEILRIDSENEQAKLGLAQAVLFEGDVQRCLHLFDEAVARANTAEKKADLRLLQAEQLLAEGSSEIAYDVLARTKLDFPAFVERIDPLLSNCLQELGRFEEALALIVSHLPQPGEETPEDLPLFAGWLACTIRSGKKNIVSQVLARFRKLLKRITDSEERDLVKMALIHLGKEHMLSLEFQLGEHFLQLASELDPKDVFLRSFKQEAKRAAQVQNELERYQKDRHIFFPPLGLKLTEWFYGEFMPEEVMAEFLDMVPEELLDELDEEYAFAIVQLKKKYPLLYKNFQEDLSDLYESCTQGLNREMRRMLEKMRR